MPISSDLSCFGLRSQPFSKEIDDQDLWLPESKAELVAEIEEAVQGRESVLLLGEPGVGKTCVLRALRRRLPEAGFRLTYCRNTTLGRRDFYRYLCHALGLQPTTSAANLFLAVEHHVHEMRRDKIHPVFLLDEAHLLHQDVLEHLHVLANYEWDRRPLLSLVLVGLPELWGRMALRKNRSLWSRVHCRITIPAAEVGDTTEYVDHRLRRVGAKKMLLASDALTLLHEATAGQLRDIDRVATKALRLCARRKLHAVDRELLEQVLEADQNPRGAP